MIDLNEAERQALDFASRALENQPLLNHEVIEKLVNAGVAMAKVTFPDETINAEALIAEISHAASVWIESPVVLTDEKVLPWWKERKREIEPMVFWRRYRKYLGVCRT